MRTHDEVEEHLRGLILTMLDMEDLPDEDEDEDEEEEEDFDDEDQGGD